MFRRRHAIRDPVRLRFQDRELVAERGDSVAAALLAAGIECFRETALSGARRAPFCLIGNCFDCLLEIDGQPNRQSCLLPVRDGMVVRTQRANGRDD